MHLLTSLSLNSVKQTKVESSLVLFPVTTYRAVSTHIHGEGFSVAHTHSQKTQICFFTIGIFNNSKSVTSVTLVFNTMYNIFTGNRAKIEGPYGQIDTGSLGDMQTILERNNRSIFLQIKTASHKNMMPILVEVLTQ